MIAFSHLKHNPRASPFVFGFSFLAATSLSFSPRDRIRVAQIYAMSFTLATAVGISVQANGRWNSYHPINIALFASLAIAYVFFLAFEDSRAFYRADRETVLVSRQ